MRFYIGDGGGEEGGDEHGESCAQAALFADALLVGKVGAGWRALGVAM